MQTAFLALQILLTGLQTVLTALLLVKEFGQKKKRPKRKKRRGRNRRS
ncbi:hypothetical protein WJ0W_007184 [Paenibacillus melissococcoides]|uniref:Uncharacterized protein n=1 Tax=Paenibacillus melissococcoides TaxID=2912268 RepID=A0ABN8UBH4_9BACL|nr:MULTISPECIES: hypothetical protein [Paenibacillus]GIO81875.1 hypothetical protein J6TS7_54850 [Paenibacillus dendritiformis]CAH8248516.1 hypothetical protein WJ0W_007184 [Paenibacillus melissococcoides]CAH8721996.1 hypothetical protein HTL2_006641 [Paenibacillus melissococcoides]CAH8722064.1 hypothetical protein WDD9_006603 [Paenibacillus melissococcoides]